MMEDFEEELGSGSGMSCVAVMAAHRRSLGASAPGTQSEKPLGKPLVTEALYKPASADQVQENNALLEISDVHARLKEQEGLTYTHGAFTGAIEEETARALHHSIVKLYDAQNHAIVVKGKKEEKRFEGFDGYPKHIGSHFDDPDGAHRHRGAGVVIGRCFHEDECDNRNSARG